jgi:hypothetical protein
MCAFPWHRFALSSRGLKELRYLWEVPVHMHAVHVLLLASASFELARRLCAGGRMGI